MAKNEQRRLPSPLRPVRPDAGPRPRPGGRPTVPEVTGDDTAPGAALDHTALDAAHHTRHGREELPLRDDTAEYMARRDRAV